MKTMPVSESLLTCASCGATIYPEHMDRHMAGYWSGMLLCSICLEEKKSGGPTPLSDPPATSHPAPLAPTAVALTGQIPEPAGPVPAACTLAKSAIRVRTFHARLAEVAAGQLDRQMNDWLDQHPGVEVKFANTTVGAREGGQDDPSLIITLFYQEG